MMSEPTFAAFADSSRIARGSVTEVVRACHAQLASLGSRRLAIYDLDRGQVVDVDFSGDEDAVLRRVEERFPHESTFPERSCDSEGVVGGAPKPKRRGRPKLGVVGREVTLLPRHWEWLEQQSGGASATLRRLVEAARRADREVGEMRRLVHRMYGFMSDIAGDLVHFEEASRSLFAQDFERLTTLIEPWPADIRDEMHRYIAAARAL